VKPDTADYLDKAHRCPVGARTTAAAGLPDVAAREAHLAPVVGRGMAARPLKRIPQPGGMDCVFRSIVITDSSGRRSSNPGEGDHGFRSKAITHSSDRDQHGMTG